jgi:hypothetical protein
MPDELPGNSHRQKGQPRKKLDAVVTGETKARKAPLRKRFAETFVQGDAPSVWSYVFWDVMVPKTKDIIVDMTQEGIQRLMFGDSRSGRRTTSGSSTNYHDRYNPDRAMGRERGMSRRARSTHDFREILIHERVEAEEVLDTLTEAVKMYGTASVADFYALCGEPASPVDQNWGWTDVRDAEVRRDRDMYYIDMPRPRPLDD